MPQRDADGRAALPKKHHRIVTQAIRTSGPIDVRRLIAMAALQLLIGSAHACLFARDTKPAQWYEWSRELFSGEVTRVERDPRKPLDLITVRVAEVFKGPEGAALATLQVPHRMWTSCRLERPALGAHVLVGLNPSGDTLIVPLSASFTERLREERRGN